MLLDRGPVDPVDVDLWTRPGPRTNLEGDAAALAAQLAGAQGLIAGRQSTMASDTTMRPVVDAGLDLDAQLDELARQTIAFDPSIGGVADSANTQAGDLLGLSNDAAQDIAGAIEPEAGPQPHYGPDPTWGVGEGNPPEVPEPPPPPGGTVADLITAYYQKYLRRDPGLEGINAWAPLWPNQAAIEHGILFSGEYADKVNGLYQQYFERDVTGGELADARAKFWGLDDVEDDLRQRA